MRETPRILLLTTIHQDAQMFRDLLIGEYPEVRIEFDVHDFMTAFEQFRPHVLVLGLRTVAESEQRYRELFRSPQVDIPPPYKTLLLCGKDDVKRAYELCRTDRFDDYILFWPMAHDAPRLTMSVHHALRFLEASREAALLPDLRLQARRIATLEQALDDERAVAVACAERAKVAIEAVSATIRTSLDAFGRRMIDTGLDEAVVVRDIARLLRELDEFDRLSIVPPVAAALDAARPVGEWIAALPSRLDPHLEPARDLAARAASHRPFVLVVDDDEFMRKLLHRLLETGGYDAEGVATAAQAVAFLRGRQPDLMLMDVRLPDLDGIQLTRQLKAIDAYARIPIIMLTGQGNKQVLVDSRHAGACDFVVKPFDRDTLLRKVATQLAMQAPVREPV